jgi:hypothetical protein
MTSLWRRNKSGPQIQMLIPRSAVLQPAHVPRAQDVPVDQLRMPSRVDTIPQRRLDYLHTSQPLLQCEGTVLARIVGGSRVSSSPMIIPW